MAVNEWWIFYFRQCVYSRVTESLLGGGGKGGQTFIGGRGGSRGRHRNDFFPITFIVHNQKSNGGGGKWGAHGANGGGGGMGPQATP